MTKKTVKSYEGPRPDILRLLQHPQKVLDVGCNKGRLGHTIKQVWPDAIVTGWDHNKVAIDRARTVLDFAKELNLNDVEAVRMSLKDNRFDTIICADVLEHLIDPWIVFRLLYDALSPGGSILVSIPNQGRYELFWHLVSQRLPRRSRGHLR